MLIQNALKITDTDGSVSYLKSTFRHDYVVHKILNGDEVILDGGDSLHDGGYYIRRCSASCAQDWSVTEKSSVKELSERILWGTKGRSGKEPFKWVCLNDCETEHLENIERNTPNIAAAQSLAIKVILDIRQGNDLESLPRSVTKIKKDA